jgi:hypothetical protein
MQREGVFREMKQRRSYEKPSERKTREKSEAILDVRVCTPRGRVLQSDELDELEPQQEMDIMAKGQQRGNREAKKPKKEKAKVIAAAPSRKEAAWQPDFGPAKKK